MGSSVILAEQQSSAEQVLSRCRTVVHPALVSAVERLHPATRPIAAYACGVSLPGDAAAPAGAGGGKGIRQALAVLAGEAVGGKAESAAPAAVAVELIHAFSLVHDDIMDHDEWRRHRPTVWKEFGTGQAVLTGDALLALALDVASAASARHCRQAVGVLSAALSGLMRGQAADLHFEDRPWQGPDAVMPAEYRSMAVNKTGALFGCAAALGALLAGGERTSVAAFGAAGRRLGLAFQAVDDLLGIWGDPARTGKPVGNDLRRRKKTLPVVAVLARQDAAARKLAALLEGERELSEEQVLLATGLIEESGGRDLVLAEGRRALGLAGSALADVPLRPRSWLELTALSDYLVGRCL
jgi:geranylgeranyl diphosphate synthase type I